MTAKSAPKKVPSVTLVLGAGVSKKLVPEWDELADGVVEACNAGDQLKSSSRPRCERLPNDNQVRLELAWRALRDEYVARALAEKKADGRNIGERMLALETKVEKAWFETLRAEIYPKNRQPYLDARHAGNHSGETSPSTTLNAIVQLLTEGDDARPIQRVVTFNADDWLEYGLTRTVEKDDSERGATKFHRQFRVVSQPTYGPNSLVRVQPDSDDDTSLRSRIPIIHAHGLLCHPAENKQATASYATSNQQGRPPPYDAPNMLVFRDLDYWRMTSNATSFANHVMLNALSTSRCVFVGLSMRDLNLLRWFGTLAAEYATAWQDRWRLHFDVGDDRVGAADAWARRSDSHVWLTDSRDPVLEKMLEYRGVRQLTTNWSTSTGPDSVGERLREALEYKKSPDATASPAKAAKRSAPNSLKKKPARKR